MMTGVVVAALLGAAAWILYGPGSNPAAGLGRGPCSGAGTRHAGLAGSARNEDIRNEGNVPQRTEARGISDPALMLDLVAAILLAGRPLPLALTILAESADRCTARLLARVVTALELGSDWQGAWMLALGSSPGAAPKEAAQTRAAADVLRSALAFAASSGAPSAAVLHAQAEQIRRTRARAAERRAAALGVHLVLPLGLCALPAFICLTVVPLLLALLPAF